MALNISFRIQAIDDFSKTMQNLESKTKKTFDAFGKVGKAATGMGLVTAGGFGIALKVAADFESQMSRVAAISGATGDDLNDLRQAALDLGASTSKSASEVALGMEEMAKKGFEVGDVLAAMPGIISASEASGEDMALVSNVVASALNSFGLEAGEASRVADVMAMAANKSSADINDLGYAFKYAAPLANTLGYDMETLAAATGIMTDAGMAGEQAGTSLRMALIRLSDPPNEAAKQMEALGLKVTDAEGNMLPFDNIVKQLADSTDGMGNAAKLAALSTIFGAEAASGMLTVIDAGPDKLREFTDELYNSEGSAMDTAAAMKDNLKGALEELGGAFETLLISVGTTITPVIQALTEWLTKLINWFNGLSEGTRTVITVIGALTGLFLLLLGPILILVAMVPSIVAGFSAIAAAVGIASSTLLIIIGVVFAVVAALVAIGIGLYQAYQKVEWFRDAVDTAWSWIKKAWNTALEFIKQIVTTIISEVSGFIGEQLAKIQKFWDENGEQIKRIVSKFMSFVGENIAAGMDFIKGVFEVVWPIISGAVKIAWELIKTITSTGIDIILGLIEAGMDLLEGDWEGAWDAIKGIAEDIWNNIESFFENIDLFQIGKDIIQGLINGIGSMGGAIKRKVQSMASLIPSWAKDMLGIHSPSRVMMELGGYTGEGMALGIEKSIGMVQKASEAMAVAPVKGYNSANSRNNAGGNNSATASSTTQRIEIPLYLDGYEIARATYPHVDGFQAFDMKNNSYMKGMKR